MNVHEKIIFLREYNEWLLSEGWSVDTDIVEEMTDDDLRYFLYTIE